jgi:hypothetical protein
MVVRVEKNVDPGVGGNALQRSRELVTVAGNTTVHEKQTVTGGERHNIGSAIHY